ncbi:IclR family transcriptional regulator [Azospirillum palustre]
MVKSADEERTKAGNDGEREGPAGTLARGLAILDAIVDAPQPLMLGEVAALTRLDQSTTLRLLRTLEDSGYVVRLADSKRYAPSPKGLLPLPLMHPINQLRRESHSVLIELARNLRETVVLVLYLSTERMVTDIAQAPGSLSPYYNTWLQGPLHGSGSGKALLLSLDPEQRAAVLGPEPYKVYTPQTIVSQAELDEDLRVSALRGYVVAHDEHHVGLTAIAANIPTWNNGHVGCLVVTGHSRDMDEARIAGIGEELVRVAKLMPYQLGSLRSVAHVVGK